MVDIQKIFYDSKAILQGHFVLSSGKHSEYYFQCAKVLEDTKVAQIVVEALADKVRQYVSKKFSCDVTELFDVVVSPAIGGLIVGYELARNLGLSFVFCERVEGNFMFRRGFSVQSGAKVLLVEDVVTTAKSSLEVINLLDKNKANVILEACLIDRSHQKSSNILPCELIHLLEFSKPLYDANNLPYNLKNIAPTVLGSNLKNISDGKKIK